MKVKLILIISLFSQVLLGQNLKINECFIDTENEIKFCIASDSLTHHKHFGDSFRLLVVVDSERNTTLEKFYLNVNRSPDFPYKLNTKFYDTSGLIIIEGYATFYLFSPTEKKISKQIFPDYTDCEFSDGQGSYIRNLVIRDNNSMLELKVDECGIHQFNIEDLENIKEIF